MQPSGGPGLLRVWAFKRELGTMGYLFSPRRAQTGFWAVPSTGYEPVKSPSGSVGSGSVQESGTSMDGA